MYIYNLVKKEEGLIATLSKQGYNALNDSANGKFIDEEHRQSLPRLTWEETEEKEQMTEESIHFTNKVISQTDHSSNYQLLKNDSKLALTHLKTSLAII